MACMTSATSACSVRADTHPLANAKRATNFPQSSRPSSWLGTSNRSPIASRTHAAFQVEAFSTSYTQPLASSEVASYNLRRRQATTAPWFQKAIRQIVKRVDDSPLLQTITLHDGEHAQLDSFNISQDVVDAPELWHAVAQHVSQTTPDVVVLVQHVKPSPALGQQQHEHQEQHDQQQEHDEAAAARVKAEQMCRRLVASGVAESILTGSVGDCCQTDSELDDEAATGSQAPALAASAILPFLRHTKRRTVRAAALGLPGPSAAGGLASDAPCYWGVVVQSRGLSTGVEGAYLLKTVRSTATTGCSCTHYSLTRISQGEAPERQFVRSWLA